MFKNFQKIILIICVFFANNLSFESFAEKNILPNKYLNWDDKLIHQVAEKPKAKKVVFKTVDGRFLTLSTYAEKIVSTMSPNIISLSRNIETSFKVKYTVKGKNAPNSRNVLETGYKLTCLENFDPRLLPNIIISGLLGLPIATFDSFFGSLGSGSSIASWSIGSFASLNASYDNLQNELRRIVTPGSGLFNVPNGPGGNAGATYLLAPGKTVYVNVTKNQTVGTSGNASVSKAKSTVESCLGPVTVKVYAKLMSSSQKSTDYVELEGNPIQIWI